MRSTLKDFALRGAEIGIVEKMELALIMSSDDPDGDHPEWVGNSLARMIEGDWADKPCERPEGARQWTRHY